MISKKSTVRSDPSPGGYRPYVSARRPGGKPSKKPGFRVLVHRKYLPIWNEIPERAGLENAQQFYDHVAYTPGVIPSVGSSVILKGKAGKPMKPGYSRTMHYSITGAGRINYQWSRKAKDGAKGDAHPVVKILTINLDSH